MRKILFRGKSKNGGEWVEGFFVLAEDVCKPDNAITPFIFETDLIHYGCGEFNSATEVIPETVGQFTGLTDKNGNRIFEGDIIKSEIGSYVVKWLTGSYCCSLIESEYLTLLSTTHIEKVIGNIHDNPDLLQSVEEARK